VAGAEGAVVVVVGAGMLLVSEVDGDDVEVEVGAGAFVDSGVAGGGDSLSPQAAAATAKPTMARPCVKREKRFCDRMGGTIQEAAAAAPRCRCSLEAGEMHDIPLAAP
jgi:hypothetical protein